MLKKNQVSEFILGTLVFGVSSVHMICGDFYVFVKADLLTKPLADALFFKLRYVSGW